MAPIDQLSEQALDQAFPWVQPLRAGLKALKPPEYTSSHIMLGSDYSGTHKQSRYLTYCFLAIDEERSRRWPQARAKWRETYLPDKRTLSFKKLGDQVRARALAPFINTLSHLHGHCIVIAIPKKVSVYRPFRGLWEGFAGREVPGCVLVGGL